MKPDPADYVRLLQYHTKWFGGRTVPWSDLANQGTFGLLRAAEAYDEDRGISFLSYASVCINYAMREFLRKEYAYKKRFTVDADLDHFDVYDAEESVADEHNVRPEFEPEDLDRLSAALGLLNDRERRIIVARFALNNVEARTLEQLGYELGITKERTRQLEARALEKLRGFLGQKYGVPKKRPAAVIPKLKAQVVPRRFNSPVNPPSTKRGKRMPLPMKNATPPRELPSAEVHQAICVSHYHIGTQHNKQYNKYNDQIILTFAILDQRRSDGTYFYVSTNSMSLSFGDQAHLTKLYKGWFGRVPDLEEGYDTSTLLRQQCFLTIVHQESGGKVYANIAGVMGLPKSVPPLPYDEDFIDYSPINPNEPLPDYIPGWIAKKIRSSVEWVSVHGEPVEDDDRGGVPAQRQNGQGRPSPDLVKQVNGIMSPLREATAPAVGLASAVPTKPPAKIKGYVLALGIGWPYTEQELDSKLAEAKDSEDEATLSEYEAALRPFVEDDIPF